MKGPSVTLIQDTRRAKKDQTYPVKLRITHCRKQRYWSTGIDLTKDQFKEVIAERPKRAFQVLNHKLKTIERNAENAIDGMNDFSFRQFEIKIGVSSIDIQNVFSFYEEYIRELKKDDRVGTADNYKCSMNSLKRYRLNIGFKDIDGTFLKAYEKWMVNSGNSLTTVGIYLRCLRTMFNKAINEGVLSKRKRKHC